MNKTYQYKQNQMVKINIIRKVTINICSRFTVDQGCRVRTAEKGDNLFVVPLVYQQIPLPTKDIVAFLQLLVLDRRWEMMVF